MTFATEFKKHSSPAIGALLVLVSSTLLVGQTLEAKPEKAATSTSSGELQTLIDTSRSNLGQIQTWRGRARIRLERKRTELVNEDATEIIVGTVSFIYDLNHGTIRAEWTLDDEASELIYSSPNKIRASFERFNPVCWQFPTKFNIVGKTFGHFQRLLNSDKSEMERVTRRDSIVRVWIGPSEASCNIYELDLDQGAALLRYQTMDQRKAELTWTLNPQRVDGIWIARKTTRKAAGPTYQELEVIDWIENEITRYGG